MRSTNCPGVCTKPGTYYQGWFMYMRYTQGQNEEYLHYPGVCTKEVLATQVPLHPHCRYLPVRSMNEIVSIRHLVSRIRFDRPHTLKRTLEKPILRWRHQHNNNNRNNNNNNSINNNNTKKLVQMKTRALRRRWMLTSA